VSKVRESKRLFQEMKIENVDQKRMSIINPKIIIVN
jgi:hypothetical protein